MKTSPLNYASKLIRALAPQEAGEPSRAPLVRGAELYGHLRRLNEDPLTLMLDVSRGYGGIARLQFGPTNAHVLTDPELIRDVMLKRQPLFSKNTRGFQKLKLLLGEGLLTSDGSFWRRQRRIAQPVFRRKRVKVFGQSMVRLTQELIDTQLEPVLDSNQARDISVDMMALTLNIVGETLLGSDMHGFSGRVGDAVETLMHGAQERIRSPWDFIENLPLPKNALYQRLMDDLDAIVRGMIERRRESPITEDNDDDLLGMLLAARDNETGEGMSDQQLRDEVMTIFLAGHETTGNALTWTLAMLSKHPAVTRRLEEEVDEVLGGRPPVYEDLEKLTYTKQVLQETMRLYPPAWIFSRCVEEDTEIGGYSVRKDEVVVVSVHALHRNPLYWSNPEGFDPERFDPAHAPTDASYQYMPFGAGPRICIGKHFAMMEMQLALATLVQKIRFHLVPGHPLVPEPLITLRPKHGVMMTLHRREGAVT